MYIEVPFAAVKPCKLFDRILPSMFTFSGFDIEESADIDNIFEDDTLEEIAQKCQRF